ncbi:MAG: rubrerythrin family protein [Sphingomonadaceae bacterium]
MKKMTEENLKASFAGESQAHVKYLAFAERAEREGLPNVARLFRAASFAEQVHATRHLQVLKGIGSTLDNLSAAIDGETFEFEEMYPSYMAVADAQGESTAFKSMQRANEAEKVHAQLYTRAKEAAAASRDVEMGPVVVCQACGYTAEGEAPDKCPLCGASKERFSKF